MSTEFKRIIIDIIAIIFITYISFIIYGSLSFTGQIAGGSKDDENYFLVVIILILTYLLVRYGIVIYNNLKSRK